VSAEVVREVSQALMASDVMLTDNPELLMSEVAELSVASRLRAESDDALVARVRRLTDAEMGLLDLYYFDRLSISEIACVTGSTEAGISL
jgi:hypothetical protein